MILYTIDDKIFQTFSQEPSISNKYYIEDRIFLMQVYAY